MGRRLREIASPFVAAAPALTAASSSRWAGTITRTSEDSWQFADRNLKAERLSLQSRVTAIESRLKVPAGTRQGRLRGYVTQAERFGKQQRLQALRARLAGVEERITAGRVSVCRGGRKLAKTQHNLAATGKSPEQWRREWDAARWFLTADGEASKRLGNETIRWDPDGDWLELKLPAPLANLANAPHDRYRLECSVSFPYRGDEVAAQTAGGSVRYDISYDPGRDRWYLDASWRVPARPVPAVEELREAPVLAADRPGDGEAAATGPSPRACPLPGSGTASLKCASMPGCT
jgi:hypothetical protein